MHIGYKLATRAIDLAVKGIDKYLVGKNYGRPALAFASPGTNFAPDPKLYRNEQTPPSLDARVRAYYSTPDVQTSHLPTAREMLYKLFNFF
ncbi:hypothetical protein HYU16_04010 [Candidatus Woesearchaeota archaeon]|nr:hypothetical protein [Candidatus Woesearchaeota archaeon]